LLFKNDIADFDFGNPDSINK